MLENGFCRRRSYRAACFAWITAIACTQVPAADAPAPPQVQFQELFTAVQTAKIFADGKTFVDAVPRQSPAAILATYRRERPRGHDALRAFVAAHFVLPAAAASDDAQSRDVPIDAHIDRLWERLTRTTSSAPPYSSLLTLPEAYVVPGGRFREIYYWDAYFTMLGLLESGRRDLVQGMVNDFAYLITTYGHIPNGTRTYYSSRSQPPFFFAMVGLLAPDDPPRAYALHLAALRREYAYWMRGGDTLVPGQARLRVVKLADGSVLNRYWDDRDTPRDESYAEDVELAQGTRRDPHQLYRDIRAAAESGWDFSSRWFADGQHRATLNTTEIVPVDLNALLFGLERAISRGCDRAADARCARDFERRASGRRAALDRYLWDESAGAYLDYQFIRKTRIRRVSAATLYPLFVDAATPDEALAVAATVQRELLKSGGIVATAMDTGEQWDSPNGWAPLQWIAVDGLRRHDQSALAEVIACRWMAGVNRLYQDSGKLVEKYDVVDLGRRGGGGEYPTQDGFGWTNGVMRRLMADYPDKASVGSAGQCPSPAPAALSRFR